MRMELCRWTVAAVTVGMTLAVGAKAQSSEPACSVGFNGVAGLGNWGRGAYYTTAKTTFEQLLPDGGKVSGFIRTHMAHDSAGRVRSETGQGCVRDENGEPRAQIGVNIFDPTTKTTMSWFVGNMGMPDVVRLVHATAKPRSQTPEELAAQRKLSQRWQPPKSEYKTEDLGTKTIAGIEAHGSRTTRTIPPGEEGNELQLVTTSETWRSEKLGFTMLSINDDPRRGKTTYEIEELVQGEPDPSVFAPPEGYKIKDITPVETASTAQ